MDRIKRLSYEVLESHKSKFGEDFADNKKILDQISIIRSKGLKNEVAGYITKFIKKEIRNEKAKQLQIESSSQSKVSIKEEIPTEPAESITGSEETSLETPEETLEVKETIETPEETLEVKETIETPEEKQE